MSNGHRPDFFGKEQLRRRWARSEVAGVTLLTVANGGDNLSVYIPLFSIQRAFIPLYVLVFGVMTVLSHLYDFRGRDEGYRRLPALTTLAKKL